MQKIITKPFNILKQNLLYIQPLLLLLLTLMTASPYVLGTGKLSIPNIVLIVSMFMLTAAFSAGWFFINKLAVVSYNEDDTKEESTAKSILNFKKFFEGVGRYFLKISVSFVILAGIYLAVFYGIFKLLYFQIGIPGFIYELPKVLNTNSQDEISAFLNTITYHDKISFLVWILSYNIAVVVLNYCVSVYFTILVFTEKNIFKTALETVNFLFKNILMSLFIIVFTEIIYFCINVLSAFAGSNIIAFIIIVILFTIYLNYYLLLVFCFYYGKSKITCDNGSELLGQD